MACDNKLCPHCGKNIEPTVPELLREIKALESEIARLKQPPQTIPFPAGKPHDYMRDWERQMEREQKRRQRENDIMFRCERETHGLY